MCDDEEEEVETLMRDLELAIPQWPRFVPRKVGGEWRAYSRIGRLFFCGDSSIGIGEAYLDLEARIALQAAEN
ncbi:MAG: hypothetical protein ACLQVD_08020 [Capsulimonadaceae bacterium]